MLGKQSGLDGGEHAYLDHVGRDSFYGFLASHRRELFHDEDITDLSCSDNGRPSVPPSLMAATVANLTLVGMSTGLMRDRNHPKTIVSIHICALLATLIAICRIFATLSLEPRLWNHTWSQGFRPRF